MKNGTINLRKIASLILIPLPLFSIPIFALSSCTTIDTKDEYARAAGSQQACLHQAETQYEITIFDQKNKDNNGKMKTKTTCAHVIAQSDIEKQNMKK
ncbi:hypothetical protein L0668_19230 [Paraglaciecola aquimarina]|uniref:Lipoprotein n=1 Tax=Paraglaciecola algarum TaxID=3050085 RepID=A0ABS9DBD7_9ALTE|nr:hypothetical protein [Paraglaciecola sp. G1-23]MCF2950249.1 hypothetical protein [Paraglaciecola sp. G1-23]